MKIRDLKGKRGILGCIRILFASMLLATLAFTHTGCRSDDDDKTVYTVTFETDGGTPAPSFQNVEAGSTVTAPSANPTKTGYVFLFWHLSGSTTAYNFQSPVNGNITLYAKWQEEATAEYWQVAWNLNGGTWPSGDNHATQVLKGGTLAEPNAPTKSGSTFDGWYKESGLTNKIDFPYDLSGVKGNFTLHAKWTTTGNGGNYQTFTSISSLKSWLASQPANTAGTPYKVELKSVNLDSGNNWSDLGVTIGDNKTKYVDLNLSGCTGTTIPDGRREKTNTTVTYYGTFVDCDNLISITIPSGLTAIGAYAFYDCDGLETFTLHEGLLTIGEGAFGSSGLKSIVIPESITAISDRTFDDCSLLSSVILPEGLQSIGKYAFYSNKALTTITIPAGVKSIGGAAFAFSSRLGDVIVLPVAPPTIVIDEEVNIFNGCSSSSFKIKVPSTSVDAYKTAYGWIGYASKIIAKTD